ncbi:MAG TPA: hypothetical protein VHO26_11995 [Propionibacteriaceae bacterium]|nr:hypothetical protein [Propionibacteriaceae bacterium]
MDFGGGWVVVPVLWCGLGLTVVVCGLRARRSEPTYRVGIAAVSALWLVGGAAVNVAMLADGITYTGFAGGSPIPFVRDTWESLVVPHHHLFIALLIAGETLAGLLVLVPGQVRQGALIALMVFNTTLLVFGLAFALWAVPLVTGLGSLHRAGRLTGLASARLRNPLRRPSGGASWGRHRSPRTRVPSP